MHRYLVERTFDINEELYLPGIDDSLKKHIDFFRNNAHDGVIWVHSYISLDKRKSFCIYDAPSPEAIRRASERNKLPVDRILEVNLLPSLIQIPPGGDFPETLLMDHEIRGSVI